MQTSGVLHRNYVFSRMILSQETTQIVVYEWRVRYLHLMVVTVCGFIHIRRHFSWLYWTRVLYTNVKIPINTFHPVYLVYFMACLYLPVRIFLPGSDGMISYDALGSFLSFRIGYHLI